MGRLLWLPDAALATGHPVTLVKGWETRGSADFNPQGIVDHNTAGPATGDMPSLGILTNGRADLAGPLSQVGIGRSGRIYVVASGRANHAGVGGWRGLTGNSSVIGIEPEHTGRSGEPWPEVQVDAIYRFMAECCKRAYIDPEMICSHAEWATPPGRKVDPVGRPGHITRAAVRALLAGGTMNDITARNITASGRITAASLTVTGSALEQGRDPGLDEELKAAWEWATKQRGGKTGVYPETKNPDDLTRAEELANVLRRLWLNIIAPALAERDEVIADLIARVEALEGAAPGGGLKRGDTVKLV